ncbi:MAG: DnaJ domain-containing protein [Drouetiella hepatica Uher 2000/2452]|jgi:curved DNA-binding protein CbpA|uniref:DnaJ domain-containing protein n=1 Tax=Drouetiella hepatica Uher 2000/2452 TaxID=904376 RepID=A0A951QBX7_9CYAN|nr:DnaJ domain-containing protein [Drouetiella hepatica Uher 2000/2452]
MSQTSFSADWPNQFSDPYAILGLAVAADDRRVLKRYRAVAKLLHPDGFVGADAATTELATQLLTRVVNPAYQRLKQEKERADTLATLRFRVRRFNRDEPLLAQSVPARQLLQKPPQELEVFYEQAVDALATSQFQPLGQFESITQQLSELNLVYLYLKMGEPMIREKRSGIVAASQVKPIPPVETAQIVSTYGRRHYQRAIIYAKNANWPQAIAELRDAIRLEPDKAEYHSLIAKAYLMQNLMGMAKVHFRQALKFNPKDPLALDYVTRLKLVLDKPDRVTNSSTPVKSTGNGLFGLFSRKP